MTGTRSSVTSTGVDWPVLRVDDWAETRRTLHMWMQVIGKVRLALGPMVNHWWQVPLYLSARGLTTSPMPHRGRLLEIEFDFWDHELHLRSSAGPTRHLVLESQPVAAFYQRVLDVLAELGMPVRIDTTPTEVTEAIPFPRDTQHSTYDAGQAHLFWKQLVAVQQVFTEFRARFIGKVSPVHFFWGAMDLATTRFSGRPAPRHPGGAPHCADWVMVEGYSHELSSAGFWPGGSAEGTFYSYAYPEPPGYAERPVEPAAAGYDRQVGEFLLPYQAVRSAADPRGALLEFLQTTYAAAAEAGRWDRQALEDDPLRRASPR
ncbi:DUF5996 family protein [Saccharopolyspora sp. CA-218241]|uniref:DUF5996 family protein n=1 Tax=Saccharopolyspora sp. CA-218241 TaxID=3240027 RepID=UPI003D97BE0C